MKQLQQYQQNNNNNQILKIKPNIHVLVEWEPREAQNMKKPTNSIITNEEAKKHCPALLVDFYETRISLQ